MAFDLGTQGLPPTHPDLLDDLAARFVRNGWSIRWLHREIVLSATYRQASTHDDATHRIDPDNRWLWRMPRRRLDVEAWRDAMPAVAGNLDTTSGGPPRDLNASDNHRRTIYGTVKRRELHDMLRLFDFPDPTTHSAGRIATTTPLQQLFTLNSPLLHRQAEALVKRLQREASDDAERIRLAHRLLYAREATPREMKLAGDFLGQPPSGQAWLQYARVLLGSNEFAFVD